jgi:hypothetical protein
MTPSDLHRATPRTAASAGIAANDWPGRAAPNSVTPCRHPASHWTVSLLAATALLHFGCRVHDIDTTYGVRSGRGASSVNGTAVWSRMFQEAGHRVTSVGRFSPRLDRFATIVWAPDDFLPPSLEQRVVLESWLANGSRTLIYVGRDYDAAPSYWEKMAAQADSGDALEMLVRRAAAMAVEDRSRAQFSGTSFARWFTARRGRPQRATQITSKHGWVEGIAQQQLEIYVSTRFDRPTAADIVSGAIVGATATLGALEESAFLDLEDALLQHRLPTDVDVLLDSDVGPLVTRVTDQAWPQSQILVVTNGSFLLNCPLVNREHRKLADKLIGRCGTAGDVAFLETDAADRRLIFDDAPQRFPTGLEVLTVWPLGAIVMQAMLLGIMACFALFPIFGRARELDPAPAGDFGRHIDALGELLERTRDATFAREQVRQYYRLVRGDADLKQAHAGSDPQ